MRVRVHFVPQTVLYHDTPTPGSLPRSSRRCPQAHFLKNVDSQLTKAVAGLPARMRLLLTGTPIQVRACVRAPTRLSLAACIHCGMRC